MSSVAVGETQSPPQRDVAVHLVVAEKFMDAFYSFEPAPLQAILSSATKVSRGEIICTSR
jgi:hypothetical protein